MSESSDDFELSEADHDMIMEGVSGKPLKPANLAAGIASMRQRIAQLEAEKAKLLDRMDTATGDPQATLTKHLVEINREIATARERLAHYESQVDRQN